MNDGQLLPFQLEPGYQLFVSLVKMVLESFAALLFIQTMLCLLIARHSFLLLKIPVNAGIFFYYLLIYLHIYGQQRMAIVYSMSLLTFAYLIKNKYSKARFYAGD